MLEDALGVLLGAPPRVSVAGRTDAGVHAAGQVVSFRVGPAAGRETDPARIQRALNGMLAPEVVVRGAVRAPDGFDARSSATGREYRYRVHTDDWPDPFTARFVWHRPGALPLGPMRRAARDLVGRHDFRAFCRAPRAPASTERHLRRLAVSASGGVVTVTAAADGFLHQMVRSLVGTLVDVAEGRIAADAMPAVLAARERGAAGRVAPPQGLTLERVRYGHPLTMERNRR